MKRADRRHRWRATSVRVRLGLALALALLPVLVLSGLQSALVFQRDATDKRADLVGAARRGAVAARARIAESQQLLRGLDAIATSHQCVTLLAETKARLPGYVNIIRFNKDGWVKCSATPVPVEPDRAMQPWFEALASGRTTSVSSEPESDYASDPVLLSNVRVEQTDGQFVGVLTAVITLGSLLPDRVNLAIPGDSQVALADASGQMISTAFAQDFPAHLGRWLSGDARGEGVVWLAPDRDGQDRLYTATPVVGRDVYLVLSAPSEGILSWARLNPVSAFILPILAFVLALVAVWWVAEQAVVRWVVYLRRIANLYARGRYSVRPLKAVAAPSEIRELADTFGAMAATISARDAMLKENLLAKDDLMREIHHRVKNNLQVISSLLNIQLRHLRDSGAISALNDTRQRIMALGLIYRALYESPNIKQVDFTIFLRDLIGQLLLDRKGGDHSIRTELKADPLIIDPDRLAPLALFIVEAISNACNHDFQDTEGLISIDFHVQDGHADLTVSDTGASREGEAGERTMMAVFARQLGGVIADTNDPACRHAVHLTFPLRTATPVPPSLH
jgi:two-component sensor histidine kinase